MRHDFGQGYWEQRWRHAHDPAWANEGTSAPHPYLAPGASGLTPGTALDAGCGSGTEALWLAAHGWRVTAVDISPTALARADGRAAEAGLSDLITWVEADLTVWEPNTLFDLVTTGYTHPAMPHLAFYERVSEWVVPGGALLIVGHVHTPEGTGHGHHPPTEASVTLTDIVANLDSTRWRIDTAEEHSRTRTGPGGRTVPLHDVVVRATRRP